MLVRITIVWKRYFNLVSRSTIVIKWTSFIFIQIIVSNWNINLWKIIPMKTWIFNAQYQIPNIYLQWFILPRRPSYLEPLRFFLFFPLPLTANAVFRDHAATRRMCLGESKSQKNDPNDRDFRSRKATTLDKAVATISWRSREKGQEQKRTLFDDCTFKAIGLWIPVERDHEKDNWFSICDWISICGSIIRFSFTRFLLEFRNLFHSIYYIYYIRIYYTYQLEIYRYIKFYFIFLLFFYSFCQIYLDCWNKRDACNAIWEFD